MGLIITTFRKEFWKNSPAKRYITPVTRTADIWCLQSPKNPMRTAVPKMIKQTREQEILKFCIPAKQHAFLLFRKFAYMKRFIEI